MSSCDDYFEEGRIPSVEANYLRTSDYIFFDNAEESTATMTITTIDTPWKLNIPNDWLTADRTSGSGEQEEVDVVLTAAANPSSFYRLSVLSLESGNKETYDFSQNIVAEQTSREPNVYVSETEVKMSASASSTTVSVESNSPKIEVYTKENWFTVSYNESAGIITISTTENITGNVRSGRVLFDVYRQTGQYVSETKQTYYMTVVQSVPDITVAEQNLQFNNDPETKNIEVKSDVSWSAYTYADWIEVSPEKGKAGVATLSVSVTANNTSTLREGSVFITVGTKTIELLVLQSGFYISSNVSDGKLSFTSMVSEKEFELNTNLSLWKIQEKPDWVTVTPGNGGKGKTVIKVKAADNPLVSKRTGKLVIGNDGIGYGLTINIEQAGKYFDAIEKTLQFGNTASSSTINIKTDGTWTAETDCDWISLTPAAGIGSGALSVAVTANESDDERTGRVNVTVGTTVQSFIVHQKGRYFTIDRGSSSAIPSIGGGIDLSISTNQTWRAELKNNSSWLTLSATAGQGDAELVITAKDNPSLESRTDTVIFTPANNQGVKFVVRQSGRYLKVDTEAVWFFSKGGKAKPISVDTDGTFRIEKQQDADWLTVTTNNNLVEIETQPFDGDNSRTATISFYLTGLSGENSEAKIIDVVVGQYAKNTIFTRKDFGEDIDLEVTYKDNAGFTINGYGEDKEFSAPAEEKTEIDRTEYGEDKNFDF
ncbi:MAG: hypothetical protein LUD00_13915 [Prevotellaceae bacterium]|nr:hypothetical protein [Prevotellaceae bacterium]